jgi:hypothetical protein
MKKSWSGGAKQPAGRPVKGLRAAHTSAGGHATKSSGPSKGTPARHKSDSTHTPHSVPKETVNPFGVKETKHASPFKGAKVTSVQMKSSVQKEPIKKAARKKRG